MHNKLLCCSYSFFYTVILRRDMSILFNRIAILTLTYSIIGIGLRMSSSFLTKAIGLHGGLFRFSEKGGGLVVGSVRGLHTKANSQNTSFGWYLTGFTDAVGCFVISISKVSKTRVKSKSYFCNPS